MIIDIFLFDFRNPLLLFIKKKKKKKKKIIKTNTSKWRKERNHYLRYWQRKLEVKSTMEFGKLMFQEDVIQLNN